MLQQIMSMLSNGNKVPTQLLQPFVKNNPILGQVLQMYQSGANPQQAMQYLQQQAQSNPAINQGLQMMANKNPQEQQEILNNLMQQGNNGQPINVPNVPNN